MKSKKIIGLVVLIFGVALFIFAKIEQRRVSGAKGMVNKSTSMFSGNAIGNTVGDVLKGEVSQYDTQLRLCEIGGIILIVLGGGILYFSRKKR